MKTSQRNSLSTTTGSISKPMSESNSYELTELILLPHNTSETLLCCTTSQNVGISGSTY